MKKYVYILLLTVTAIMILWLYIGCNTTPYDKPIGRIEGDAPIYPDYRDVTIPQNIAPLNFLLRHEAAERLFVVVDCEDTKMSVTSNRRGNEAVFDIAEWHELLARSAGHQLRVHVYLNTENGWMDYAPFTWTVVADKVDPYLTYQIGRASCRERV